MGTEIFFGISEIRLDSPVNKPPDGQISRPSRSTRGAENSRFSSRSTGRAYCETALSDLSIASNNIRFCEAKRTLLGPRTHKPGGVTHRGLMSALLLKRRGRCAAAK